MFYLNEFKRRIKIGNGLERRRGKNPWDWTKDCCGNCNSVVLEESCVFQIGHQLWSNIVKTILHYRSVLEQRKWKIMKRGFTALQKLVRKKFQKHETEIWRQLKTSEREFQIKLRGLKERRQMQEKIFDDLKHTPSDQFQNAFLVTNEFSFTSFRISLTFVYIFHTLVGHLSKLGISPFLW